nr:mediator of RNA polymerase II transcription subunit 1 isoform X2 [Ipomoea batatas]
MNRRFCFYAILYDIINWCEATSDPATRIKVAAPPQPRVESSDQIQPKSISVDKLSLIFCEKDNTRRRIACFAGLDEIKAFLALSSSPYHLFFYLADSISASEVLELLLGTSGGNSGPPLHHFFPSQVEKISLRRSQSLVTRKPGDLLPPRELKTQKMVSLKGLSPLVGADDKPASRVLLLPGWASAVPSLPICNSLAWVLRNGHLMAEVPLNWQQWHGNSSTQQTVLGTPTLGCQVQVLVLTWLTAYHKCQHELVSLPRESDTSKSDAEAPRCSDGVDHVLMGMIYPDE